MIEIEFLSGTPGANKEMADFARRAKIRFDLKKRAKRLSPAEMLALSAATIRETPDDEIKRRMRMRAARLVKF